MYAIVDIETTGGFTPDNRIIEIAVVIHDGQSVTSQYQTLINPQRPIPGFITGLTGIDGAMLKEAPVFEEIADELFDFLQGKIFVAHNVNFDVNFVKDAFARVGMIYNPQLLCTVRLSRKIFPGYRSYSLGTLCGQLNISIAERHRAMGDAYATAVLFGQLIQADAQGIIAASLKNRKKEVALPPHISQEKFAQLPETPGVYYFHDLHGKVIYVGKAINIKSRFKSHFSGKAKIAMKTEIHDVSYELTGNEFLALLLETLEIKKHWPKYNRSLKTKATSWGLFSYEDQQGYPRFTISKNNGQQKPILTFTNHSDAWYYLLDLVKSHQLCPKLCGIQKTTEACFDFKEGSCLGACCGEESAESYSDRVEEMLGKIRLSGSTILIKETGREVEEEAALLFENGLLAAFGFIDRSTNLHRTEDILPMLQSVKPVLETTYLLRSYLEKGKKENIYYLSGLNGMSSKA
ncbi:exonuclease domain-containing protein [Lunatibacter salilacus]|uniref:exonuclease domain-containing protein n=1 Tax=Lunatibacter salilacus TaxID=2483804 RepID=UPI00131B7391|nr:exonuclease domain-containing protein [Lunatibacter salilacus]